MLVLMFLAIYSLAFEELAYSLIGKSSSGRVTYLEEREMQSSRDGKAWTMTCHHYEIRIPNRDEPVTGEFHGSIAKVGDAVEMQYLSWWPTWSRPASQRKPWLGWGVLVTSIVIFIVAVSLGREAQDPFAKARAQRHRG